MGFKHVPQFLKVVTVLIIFLAILYFILGYLAVSINIFDQNIYFNLSAIIGGIASVVSLFSFVWSNLRKRDIEKVGIEYLKDIIEKSEELKYKEIELRNKNNDLSKKEKEIEALELKKKEIENLIQKSSMIIYFKDQYSRIEDDIVKIIQDKELEKKVNQLDKLKLKLHALNAEVESDKNVDFLKEIIRKMDEFESTPTEFSNVESYRKAKNKPISFNEKMTQLITNFFEEDQDISMN